MNNQATPAVEVERHSATTLRFATGDLAQAQYVDAKHLDAALARIAELEKPAEYQSAPAQLHFPTMLRKMWSGGEVQQWLEEQGPLYRQPMQYQGDAATLQKVYDVFGTGQLARTPSTLLTCLGNMKRFSDYLHAVEREFLMVPGESSDEDEGGGPDDDCLVNCWGAPSTESYVEQFREALATLGERNPAAQAIANAGRVAHLYNSGAGILAWIEQERKSLAASAEAGGKE
jgi:hypothetical protein